MCESTNLPKFLSWRFWIFECNIRRHIVIDGIETVAAINVKIEAFRAANKDFARKKFVKTYSI